MAKDPVSEPAHGFLKMITSALIEGAAEGTMINWFLGHARNAVDRKVNGKVDRTRNKHYFAAAMVKLRQRDQFAADVMNDFNDNFLSEANYPGRSDEVREDFQHNAANVGTDANDKMDDTVQFLYDLAQLPTHEDREIRLTALGHIGARSTDVLERAKELLASTLKLAQKSGSGAAAYLKPRLDEIKNAVPDKATVVDKATQFHGNAKQRYQDRKAARRNK